MSTYNTTVKFAELDPFGSASGSQDTKPVTEDTSVELGHSNTDQQDATVFIDDSNVVTRDQSHIVHVKDTILSLNDTNFDEQSIKSFLARPIIIRQALFSTSDNYSTFNATSQPYTAFQLPQAVIWREKLAGVFGIRFDMKFRIVVNANRFQQGRYIMSWTPLASPRRTTSNLKEFQFNNMHMATLVQRTTVPHVEIDLCDDTVGELMVPFVSARTFYPLSSILASTDNYSLGFLNVYPYSPMASPAGSITAGYTIYLSLENIRLFGAASAQSGLKRHKNVQQSEVGMSNQGPISSVSSALSKGFKEFAHIPLLSTYANSISWVADRVTSVASVFGWSKPTAGDNIAKMMVMQAPNHSTVDGDSDARPLSFLNKPGVVAMDGISGTDYDEMDFSYIVRKPAWFRTAFWSTSILAGTVLDSFVVSPYTQVLAAGTQNFQPIAFVSYMFQSWRGSLRYRFKFVRTEFHSGRLSIAFYPTTTTSTFNSNPAYVHRLIVDIRESNTIEFVVPYICDTPFCFNNTGQISISVVDPLVAPATVASSVTILMEISAGEDFEVAMPNTLGTMTPTTIVPQSGLTKESQLLTMNIGNSTVVSDPNVSSSLAIGDKVSSFRALLKRFNPVVQRDVGQVATGLWNSSCMRIMPDAVYAMGTGALPTQYILPDPYSVVASCYGLVRGGVRIRDVVSKNMMLSTSVYGPSVAKISNQVESTPLVWSTPFETVANTLNAVRQINHVQFQDLTLNPVITVESPQYTLTWGKSVCDLILFQNSTFGMNIGPDASSSLQQVLIGLPEKTAPAAAISGYQLHNIFRALADDADFSCFISVPPMYVGLTVTNPMLNLQ